MGNLVTPESFVNWFEKLYSELAVYVWGANGQIITKDTMDELYDKYGSDTYNRKYFDMKLQKGRGKIAADAAGSFYQLSKEDRTVREYFTACPIKGVIAALPKDKVCLLFNNNLTHVGAYLGNGITIEMRSSKLNMNRETLKPARWQYYGIPDFVDYGMDLDSLKKEVSRYDVIIKNYEEWLEKFVPHSNVVVDGFYNENTKENTIRAIQHIFNKFYCREIGNTGIYDEETRRACPSFEEMKWSPEGFRYLTYITHVYLYAECGYMMENIICGDKVTTTYDSTTSKYVGMYQYNIRGLEMDGKIGSATFYRMFK